MTIRAYRIGRRDNERDRTCDGYRRWYLFAWVDDRGDFANWILVDLDRLRDSALLWTQKITYNPDMKTGFIAIKIEDLRADGCIVDQREGMVEQLELGF